MRGGAGEGGRRNRTPFLYKTQEYSSNKSTVLNVRGQRLKLLERSIRNAYFTTECPSARKHHKVNGKSQT